MYNGIGLPTPRGSGTNGYIQRNFAAVKNRKEKVEYKSDADLARLERSLNQQPNQEILEHEWKRKIELKCLLLQEQLEEQGIGPSKITSVRQNCNHHSHIQITRCPPGMIFNSCGTMCPKTCANPNPRICTKGCRRGCFCRKGFLLFRGRCVRRNQCPRTRCTGGRVYKTCERRCRTTCANRKVRCRRRRCRRGCFCPRPRVWHRGRCVKLSQCQKTITRCPPKMIFNSCGTMCPRTCANPNPRICTRGCKRGCFCRKGLLLFRGRCVRRRQCPKTTRCPPKMIFNSCGTMCPRTCANPNPRICTKGCRRGCFCRKGLLLFRGRCVRRRQCPKKSSICSLSPVRGRCKGRIPRYYFNRQFRSCVRFSYSGCGGNKNNFLTVGQCLRACGPRQNQDLLSTDLASEESEDDPAVEESEDDPAVEESEYDPAAEESEDDQAAEEHDDIDSQVEEVDEDEYFPEEELEKESFF